MNLNFAQFAEKSRESMVHANAGEAVKNNKFPFARSFILTQETAYSKTNVKIRAAESLEAPTVVANECLTNIS